MQPADERIAVLERENDIFAVRIVGCSSNSSGRNPKSISKDRSNHLQGFEDEDVPERKADRRRSRRKARNGATSAICRPKTH